MKKRVERHCFSWKRDENKNLTKGGAYHLHLDAADAGKIIQESVVRPPRPYLAVSLLSCDPQKSFLVRLNCEGGKDILERKKKRENWTDGNGDGRTRPDEFTLTFSSSSSSPSFLRVIIIIIIQGDSRPSAGPRDGLVDNDETHSLNHTPTPPSTSDPNGNYWKSTALVFPSL